MTIARALLSISIYVFCSGALAQANLGELLGRGAKQQDKDALIGSLPGITASRSLSGGASIRFTFQRDGAISGTFEGPGQPGVNVVGRWSVDETGRLCTAVVAPIPTRTRCMFMFRLGEDYYASESDSDPNAPVTKRVLS